MGQRSHTTTTGGRAQDESERDGRNAMRGQRGELQGFFERQTKEERDRTMTRDFRLYARKVKRNKRKAGREGRRRRQEQHKQDRTIGITTQNVRGLAAQATNISQKLQGFKEQHLRGNRDVIFIQETHLKKEEQQAAARQYAAMWGFKHTTADTHSMWASGQQRRAGVAILVNPYGAVTKMTPWKEELWTEHLIMAMGELAGRRVLFMNVYAPANGAVRVSFFTQLLKMEVPDHVDVVCGGDFNCVEIAEIDRRGAQAKAT
jgi:hypothetical protein